MLTQSGVKNKQKKPQQTKFSYDLFETKKKNSPLHFQSYRNKIKQLQLYIIIHRFHVTSIISVYMSIIEEVCLCSIQTKVGFRGEGEGEREREGERG